MKDTDTLQAEIAELKAQLAAARHQCELRSAGHDDLRTRLNNANGSNASLRAMLKSILDMTPKGLELHGKIEKLLKVTQPGDTAFIRFAKALADSAQEVVDSDKDDRFIRLRCALLDYSEHFLTYKTAHKV